MKWVVVFSLLETGDGVGATKRRSAPFAAIDHPRKCANARATPRLAPGLDARSSMIILPAHRMKSACIHELSSRRSTNAREASAGIGNLRLRLHVFVEAE
jgi:hypothetical protein